MAAKSLVVTSLALNALLWSASRYATPDSTRFTPQSLQYDGDLHSTFLSRRWENGTSTQSDEPWQYVPLVEKTCKPLAFPVNEQCSHVRRKCPKSETFLSIQYMQGYFCTSSALKPLYFGGLLLWLVFLFSFIGITASDFFCPNLSTIAKVFGLSDNIAGVTFLAFGNGSPDLFATYSAMRADSGSLAVGELLGAASFIISVVVGSMCIIKPFHVRPGAFLRDVGFFTAAVGLLLFILFDGKILVWEAASLVGLYVTYVIAVVIGTWWSSRRERQQERESLMRAEYADEEATTDFTARGYSDGDADHEEGQLLALPSPRIRARAQSSPTRPHLQGRMSSLRRISQSQVLPSSSRSSSVSDFGRMSKSYAGPPRSPHDPTLPSFSLIGALEFRSVVDSLEKESTAAALTMFNSPATPYAAGHYHHHRTASEHSRHSRRNSRTTTLEEEEVDPWDAALAQGQHTDSPVDHPGQRVPLHTLHTGSPTRSPVLSPAGSILVTSPRSPIDGSGMLTTPNTGNEPSVVKSAPAIVERAEDSESVLAASTATLDVKPRSWARRLMSEVGHTLFPTLHNLMAPSKSWLGRIAAVFAAPAVLVLTLSLPVVIISDEEEDEDEGKPFVPEGQLVDIRISVSAPASDGEHSEEGSHHQFKQLRTSFQRPYTDNESGVIDREREEELEREGESDVSSIMSDIEREMHGAHFNKWLTAAQCAIGPLFATAVLFSTSPRLWIFLLAAFTAGAAAATLVLLFAKNGKNPIGRIVRSLMGFVVAMVWIMAIADEVVRVLQTFGYIFGLSDAIVGLTVFAIGNSLADLIANLAVARFAPIMGFSACFGGPMLNMLIGVGVSGTVVLRQTGQPYYAIDFSTTLLVSSIGLLALLLATMIFVPLNGYLLSKRWGIFLICSYIAIMTINVIVEVKEER
ncbi:hypothetical protein FRC04_003061 [Tulasnella sp. 424]|nr:hypothetical protein FRC04_003061 [Tulasnella sp. 424]KAG8981147.1 hypothetical protein FRC05_004048 [Tulasnella sp. 425]